MTCLLIRLKMVFRKKTIWQLLLRVSLKNDGLVGLLRLQKNFETRNGITEASIGFLQSIVTQALAIARKVAEDQ